jgi:hypothetical protein
MSDEQLKFRNQFCKSLYEQIEVMVFNNFGLLDEIDFDSQEEIKDDMIHYLKVAYGKGFNDALVYATNEWTDGL